MAQTRALFISENFIKRNSEIDENVDVNKLLPTVWWCQKAFIEKTLGSNLFDAITTKILADNLTGNYLTLVDAYIADALLQYFMSEVQVPLLYNYRNKSVGSNDSQWSTPIDYTQHRYLKNVYLPRAEYYTQRLESYLCENSTLFPEYTAPSTSDQLTHQDTTPPNPVFLGGSRVNPNQRFLNSSEEV